MTLGKRLNRRSIQ